jgi:hypothetical protein
MQVAAPTDVESHLFPGIRQGDLAMHDLLWGDPRSLANYHAALSTADTEYAVPRHRHNFEQVRYIINGEVRYGDEVVKGGSAVYFPEGVPYGPQVRTLGMKIFTVQFGGASRNGFVSRKEFEAGADALKKRGQFEKGSFTYFDEAGRRHRKDSFEAVWEQVRGRKLEYPKPRYGDIVVMNPENFRWIDRGDTPGVADKWLGTFTECGTRVGLTRLDAGATLTAGTHDTAEILFLTQGKVLCRGMEYAPQSAFGFEAHEGPEPIKALEPSEFFVTQMPRF